MPMDNSHFPVPCKKSIIQELIDTFDRFFDTYSEQIDLGWSIPFAGALKTHSRRQ